MKTFNDLPFETIDNGILWCKKARMDFDNNYGVSVVRHNMSYGGRDGLYEMAVLYDNEIHYENPVADGDVIGHLTEEEVTDLMKKVQEL